MRALPCILIILSLLATLTAYSQKQRYYSIGFYNLENMFDTIHDEGKNDYEFLPKGVNEWNSKKYNSKINNIASVLAQLGTEQQPAGAAFVGICEIENRNVLNDLIRAKEIADKKWQYIHMESKDSRGIDCALLYDPKQFIPVTRQLVPYKNSGGSRHRTRGFLIVSGTLAKEQIHIIVNHWPSRYSKSPAREQAATQVKALKDSIAHLHPESKLIIMGDFNDNPDNISLKDILAAKRNIAEVKATHDLYNPFWDILRKEKKGTLKYRDRWQLYDQIIISGNLCNKKRKGLKYAKNEIHVRPHMMNAEGRYKEYPKRTHADGKWLNGYSDHLPVVIYLYK
ncbi:MAG: endonuclease/exonuclease/phosphatase family protein [Bacteroidaceae bacterium]|nr:endonuclease/exonuclease/phosphatase family protein [Bacteroidaceae bacterium]